jgi:hypothetical protein
MFVRRRGRRLGKTTVGRDRRSVSRHFGSAASEKVEPMANRWCVSRHLTEPSSAATRRLSAFPTSLLMSKIEFEFSKRFRRA